MLDCSQVGWLRVGCAFCDHLLSFHDEATRASFRQLMSRSVSNNGVSISDKGSIMWMRSTFWFPKYYLPTVGVFPWNGKTTKLHKFQGSLGELKLRFDTKMVIPYHMAKIKMKIKIKKTRQEGVCVCCV